MTAVFVKVKELDSDHDNWATYVEHLNHFFKAITSNEQKLSVFFSVIESANYNLLRSLLSPEKLGNKPYKDLVTVSLYKHSRVTYLL